MKISWTIPGSPDTLFIEGFYIGYRAVSSLEPFTYKTMHILLAPSTGTSVVQVEGGRGKESSSGSSHLVDPSSSSSLSSSLHPPTLPGNMITQQNLERRFEYLVESLRKSTKYSVIVQAFNSKGAGPSTNELTIETFANGKEENDPHTHICIVYIYIYIYFSHV